MAAAARRSRKSNPPPVDVGGSPPGGPDGSGNTEDGTSVDAGVTRETPEVEQVAAEAALGAEATKKRRGRPPGPTKAKGTTSGAGTPLDLAEITQQVEGTYAMLAVFSQENAFLIGTPKAEMIAAGIVDVSRHYNMNIDSPALSILKLAAALAIVNVPIIMTIGAKRRALAAERQASARPATPEDAAFAAAEGPDGNRQAYDLSGANLEGLKF